MSDQDKLDAEAKVIEDEIAAEVRYQKGERERARAALLAAQPPTGWRKLWRGVKNFFTGNVL